LIDPNIPIETNLPKFGEPAQLYCPAGVMKLLNPVTGNYNFRLMLKIVFIVKLAILRIPSQNIVWKCPEGGGGPNYTDM
jgi:electron-transferring-flavoprotein dehydrogenase